MSYVVKVKDGKAYLYDAKTRAGKGSVGRKVVSAHMAGDFVQVTREDGKVEIYDPRTRAYKGMV